ncbi:hypothetical protein P7K49_036867 [Saguinus oedipus]|uniref:Ubiquitinyl hydrolase 1 n=1 Tax=Saguinus oedipus TaxID=9490 RepID=A0ABQ9TMZ0_SAGOE|nr:hypothetical protein P7K49_036867 [Saguinus oedipus]
MQLLGRQEDAEEYLGFILNGLHEEMVNLKKLLSPNNESRFWSTGRRVAPRDSKLSRSEQFRSPRVRKHPLRIHTYITTGPHLTKKPTLTTRLPGLCRASSPFPVLPGMSFGGIDVNQGPEKSRLLQLVAVALQLTISNGPKNHSVREEEQEEQGEGSEDEWEQVGPRNKTSVTRQADFVQTPITGIFGGHISKTCATSKEAYSAAVLGGPCESMISLQRLWCSLPGGGFSETLSLLLSQRL